MSIWKSVAALFAGALLSVVVSLYFQVWDLSVGTTKISVVVMVGLVIILILYVSDTLSKIWHHICLWLRGRKTLIGILNDAGKVKDGTNASCTCFDQWDWKKEIEQAAQAGSRKIKVRFITTRNNFIPYRAILNPYGGAYPEPDASKSETLDKILEYVNEGGLFVNVADVPGYWAYNSRVNRVFQTPQQTFIFGQPAYPFSLVPFTQRLGLTVYNVQMNWVGEFEDRFGFRETQNIRVDRVVVIERNVEPIIQPKTLNNGNNKVTPVFLVNYGRGQCMISLLFLFNTIGNRQGDFMKQKLVKILLAIVCKNK